MKTRRNFLLIVLLITSSSLLWSQTGVVNSGAKIVITSGASLKISGGTAADYTNQTASALHGRIDLDGKIHLEGDWTNNATGGSVLIGAGTTGEVLFNGSSAQFIGGVSTTDFEKLTLNNSAGLALTSDISLTGNLGFTAGSITLGDYDLTLGTGTSISGASSSKMIVTSGNGSLIKKFASAGSFLFPIGENTGTLEYSWAQLDVTSGTFGGSAWASVNVKDAKHPSNSSPTDYLTRYWIVDQNDITGFSCNVTFQYMQDDVMGTESIILGGQWTDPNWIKLSPVSASLNRVTGTVDHFSDFTGGDNSEFSITVTMSDDGTISEAAENGEPITVVLENDEFIGTLNDDHFILSNLPNGVSRGSVARNSDNQATVYLSGNRTVDFDSDITNISLEVDEDQLIYSTFSLVASSGVTITADLDAETLSISAGMITEGSEDAEEIDVTLGGGTFATILDKTNWTLSNLPLGVEILSVIRTDATHAVITLDGNRDEDYDSDITTIGLTITQDEFDESDGDLVSGDQITFTANNEIATLYSPVALSESNLDGATLTFDLENETFIDGTFDKNNFTLNNVPPGTTINTVTGNGVDTVYITLTYDGTDFDVNFTNFNVTVDPAEINGVGMETTNSLTITAVEEVQQIYLHHTPGLTEENLNTAEIGIGLRDVVFADTDLDQGNFTLVNAPEGTSISGVGYINTDTASMTLSYNGTDFDNTINDFYINVAGVELNPAVGIASHALTITATDDAESLTMTDDGTLVEGAEDGEAITVTLSGGTFADPIDPNKWALSNLPAGVTKGGITRDNATQATVALSGNRTTDYDSDITDMQLTVSSSEINDMTSGNLSATTGVTFSANNESLAISHAGAGLTETNLLDDEEIGLKLSEESFNGTYSNGNYILHNEPAGVTVSSVVGIAADSAVLTLAFDGTDFDISYDEFYITVMATELSGVTDLESDSLTITAVDEPGTATISHAGLTEANIYGESITISLDQETFLDGTLIPGNFTLNNVPAGLTVDQVNYSDATTASLVLAFDSTDFDSDYNSFDITIAGSELTKNVDITSSNTLTITATQDAESIAMSDDGSITEGAEHDEVTTVTLSGGTFIDPLTPANWNLTGLPDGVSQGMLTRVSSTSATIKLDGNRSMDYDVDITAATLSVTQDEVDEYTGVDLQATTGVTFTALVETATISDTGLVENDLSGSAIDLVLTNDVFVDGLISTVNIVLNNAPLGVSVSTAEWISNTEAKVILFYDGTDFDDDSTSFSITVLSAELLGEGDITSNSLTITAIAEPETVTISHSGLTESNINGAQIGLTLSSVEFADAVLSEANFTLNNAPAGVSLSTATWVSSTSATLTLAFDGTDFDADVTDFSVTVLPAELDPAVNITSNALTITAVVEAAGLTISDPVLTEENLDGNTLDLTLDQVEFEDGTILPANVVLNNAPAGVTVASVSHTSSTTATITLDYDGTDFDDDVLDFSVTVLAAELSGTSDVSSNAIGIDATVEPTSLTITPSVALTEENMDGAVITLSLTEVSFADNSLDPANFVLNNAPTGLNVSTATWVNDTAATLVLAYTRTDFDTDITNFSISVTLTELAEGTDLTSNDITISAIIESEQLNVSHAGLTETNLDGAVIAMDLDQVKFADATLDEANFTLNNAPAGLSITSVQYVNDSTANLELDFERGDFDSDILNFSITVDETELTEGSSLTSNSLQISAIVEDEQVAISHAGLTADNLNLAEIDMDLTNVSFVDALLDELNFMLNGAPPGTSVDSAYATGDSAGVIRIAYDGTPFTVVHEMSIMVQAAELSGLDDLTSNTLTIGLTGIDPGAAAMNLEIYSYGSRIFIRCDAPSKLKEATVFNLLGQEVSNHKLEPMPLNEIAVNNVSNSYIIRVHTTEGVHTARVYVHVR